LQCQATVAVRSSVIVCVPPGGRFVLELPSSSVNVCCVESLFVTVSVTVPELTFTEFGLNAKFCATIVAVDAPPVGAADELDVPPEVGAFVGVELLLEQALVRSASPRTTKIVLYGRRIIFPPCSRTSPVLRAGPDFGFPGARPLSGQEPYGPVRSHQATDGWEQVRGRQGQLFVLHPAEPRSAGAARLRGSFVGR